MGCLCFIGLNSYLRAPNVMEVLWRLFMWYLIYGKILSFISACVIELLIYLGLHDVVMPNEYLI
jgi:hypothetical protein